MILERFVSVKCDQFFTSSEVIIEKYTYLFMLNKSLSQRFVDVLCQVIFQSVEISRHEFNTRVWLFQIHGSADVCHDWKVLQRPIKMLSCSYLGNKVPEPLPHPLTVHLVFSFCVADFRCRGCDLSTSLQIRHVLWPGENYVHGGLLLCEPYGAEDLPLSW